MLILFKRLIKHPLITGSSIIFIGSLFANAFSYLFNIAMGRMLPVEDYGLLISLTSLLAMLTIFNIAFTKIFAKFSAKYIASGEDKKIRYLIIHGTKYIVLYSLILIVPLFISVDAVGRFLHIESHVLIFIIFLSVFFSLVVSVPSGILQGSMRFYSVSFLSIFQAAAKFIAAVVLVLLGFHIFGAVLSVLISSVGAVIVSYILISKYLSKNSGSSKIEQFRPEFLHYTYTFFLTSVGITLLSNTDILLVRHFFEETVSGQYAALSLMGKAIFYLVMPINFVFFPLIAQKKERNENLFNTIVLTSAIVFVASLTLSFIYFAFPGLVLRIFFPSPEYQVLKSYLGLFSLYILLFSLVNIMNNYFLSIGKTKVYLLTLGAAIAQICLIVFLHSSLFQIIGVLFIVNLLLLASYFIYFLKSGEKVR